MPLAFQSLSHGQVAFGFFNIETDMALLNQYFFFASDFSALIGKLAESPEGSIEAELEVYTLTERDAGNLMGAIEGIDFRGFIGETYKLYPFPKEQAKFKQNPEAYKTRETMEALIAHYATLTSIPIKCETSGNTMSIGEYSFSKPSFHELVKYVWMGGYPRWKDGVRPYYVLPMKEQIEKAEHPLFVGLSLGEQGSPGT